MNKSTKPINDHAPSHYWSSKEDEFLHKWVGSYSMREIGIFLNRTRNSVIGRVRRLGIGPGHASYRKGMTRPRHGGILRQPAGTVPHFEPRENIEGRLPLPYKR